MPGTRDGLRPGPGTHRADIQGLRAVAVALVVAYHGGDVLPGGFVGVDVFFVISGYVVTAMVVRELEATGRLRLGRFSLRRVRRLLPALAVMLAVTLLASGLLVAVGAQEPTAATGVAAALVNANTYLAFSGGGGGYFGVDASANPLLHTWSLSVEEQFYLVFPGLLLVTWLVGRRLGRSPRVALGVVLGVLGTGSFVLSWLLTTGRLDPFGRGRSLAFYSAPTRAWEFATGAGLVLLAPRLAENGRNAPGRQRAAAAGGILGVLVLAVAVLRFGPATPFPGTAALVPVVATVLLLVGGAAAPDTALSRLLGARPLTTLGDLSYSWYLWHWPVIVFATGLFPTQGAAKPIAALASILPAWLAQRFVENPIRFEVHPRPARTAIVAAVSLAVPILGALALVTVHDALSRSDVLAAFPDHEDIGRRCDLLEQDLPQDMAGDRCRWAVPGARGDAVLVGDSNAGQFTEGFVDAAHGQGFDAVVAARSACPFVDLRIWQNGREDVGCRSFVQGTLDHLVATRPRVVLLANLSDGYTEVAQTEFRSPDGLVAYRTAQERNAAWRDGLGRTVGTLRAAGIDVVIVHPAPRFPGWKPSAMAPLRLLGPTHWLEATVTRDEALARRADAVQMEAEVAATYGARTLDVFDDVCPARTCPVRAGERWLYRDGTHLSVDASRMLAVQLAGALGDR